MALPTLLDVAKRNGHDLLVGLIDETTKLIPEISGTLENGTKLNNVGAMRTIQGRMYKSLIRTGLPSVDFRDANEGQAASKSTYENRNVETFILPARWECDRAVADSSEDGPEAMIAEEAAAQVLAAMQRLGSQFFYGRNFGSAKGYPGLVDSVQAAYTYDRQGTGNACGSVYAVKFGPKDVCWVYGKNGELKVDDVRIETLRDGNNNPYDGYVQSMLCFPGVQVASLFSIGRIKNVTATNTLSDTHIYKLLSQMKARPDVLFMNRTLLEQLRSSRTATNATGAPAPTPTEVDNIPIAPTDSLTMTEVAA